MNVIIRGMIRKICIVGMVIGICFGLRVLSACFSTDMVQENLRKSKINIQNIGDYPVIPEFNNSNDWEKNAWNQNDFFTDWMIANVIYNINSDDPVSSALKNKRVMVNWSSPAASLQACMEGEGTVSDTDYPIQYWLGIISILRPMLLVWDYSQMLTFLQLIFWGSFSAAMIKIYSIGGLQLVTSFFCALALVSFTTTSFSYNFAVVFVITFLSILFIKKSEKEKNIIRDRFLLIGMFTSYFDWMTNPSITCTLPLAIMIITENLSDNDEKESELGKIWNVIIIGCNWCVGYALMLISKWVLAGIFTDESVINIVRKRVLEDTGAGIDNKWEYYIDTLKRNLGLILTEKLEIRKELIAILICIIVVRMIYDLCRERKKSLYFNLIMLSLVPFIWTRLFLWYTHEHFWFSYRNYIITIFVLVYMGVRYMSGWLNRGIIGANSLLSKRKKADIKQ